MSDKLLITEYFSLCEGGVCQDFLTEDEKRMVREDGAMFLTGVMQRADAQNGNGRIYPRRILEREMNNYQKLIKERRALGELDHPDQAVINLANASHLVTESWWDGNNVMGKIQILNTPSGKILRSLVESGVTLGISSRGMGSVTENAQGTIVEDDFNLVCYDMVSEPSTTGAFMMKEGKEPNIITKADRINRALNDVLRDK
jgi:hypothetical protein